LFSFSVRLYVMQMSAAIQDQIEKIYLAWLVGIVPVGWYNIAGEAATKIRRVPELLLTPIVAASSELHAKGDEGKLRELYYRTHKYLALVGFPLVLYVAFTARRIVDLWVGHAFEVVALPLVVLLCVNLLNLSTGPGFYILIGKGMLRPGVYSSTLAIALNVILSLWFIYLWGFRGAFIGTFASALASMSMFTYMFHHDTSYPFGRLIREAYLKPIACAVCLLLAISYSLPLNRLGWGGLALVAVGFGLAYLVALVLTRFLDDFDLVQAERFFPFLRFARKFVPLRNAQVM